MKTKSQNSIICQSRRNNYISNETKTKANQLKSNKFKDINNEEKNRNSHLTSSN